MVGEGIASAGQRAAEWALIATLGAGSVLGGTASAVWGIHARHVEDRAQALLSDAQVREDLPFTSPGSTPSVIPSPRVTSSSEATGRPGQNSMASTANPADLIPGYLATIRNEQSNELGAAASLIFFAGVGGVAMLLVSKRRRPGWR